MVIKGLECSGEIRVRRKKQCLLVIGLDNEDIVIRGNWKQIGSSFEKSNEYLSIKI